MPTHTVEILPERDDTFSVVVMDDDGSVTRSRTGLTAESAIGLASAWGKALGVTYRIVGAHHDVNRN